MAAPLLWARGFFLSGGVVDKKLIANNLDEVFMSGYGLVGFLIIFSSQCFGMEAEELKPELQESSVSDFGGYGMCYTYKWNNHNLGTREVYVDLASPMTDEFVSCLECFAQGLRSIANPADTWTGINFRFLEQFWRKCGREEKAGKLKIKFQYGNCNSEINVNLEEGGVYRLVSKSHIIDRFTAEALGRIFYSGNGEIDIDRVRNLVLSMKQKDNQQTTGNRIVNNSLPKPTTLEGTNKSNHFFDKHAKPLAIGGWISSVALGAWIFFKWWRGR